MIHFISKKETVGNATFKNELIKSISLRKNVLAITAALINSYTASLIADFIRNKLINNKISFTFETVMSHSSKLDIIDKANKHKYSTYLYYVITKDPVINLERIKNRVQKGGHNVNNNKVVERYYKSQSLLQFAINKCHRAYVFDNTTSLKLVAEYKKGKLVS